MKGIFHTSLFDGTARTTWNHLLKSTQLLFSVESMLFLLRLFRSGIILLMERPPKLIRQIVSLYVMLYETSLAEWIKRKKSIDEDETQPKTETASCWLSWSRAMTWSGCEGKTSLLNEEDFDLNDLNETIMIPSSIQLWIVTVISEDCIYGWPLINSLSFNSYSLLQ